MIRGLSYAFNLSHGEQLLRQYFASVSNLLVQRTELILIAELKSCLSKRYDVTFALNHDDSIDGKGSIAKNKSQKN